MTRKCRWQKQEMNRKPQRVQPKRTVAKLYVRWANVKVAVKPRD
jgi:hypothetical protein